MAGASDPRFADVERQYYALKSQLSGGQLTREQFEAALQKLMILDAQSRYWMMGAETGKWYMYDGQNWQQSNPPVSAAPAGARGAGSAAGAQPDSGTPASFTPPAEAAVGDTPDSAPTMTFTPPAATGSATPDSAPTMTFTPSAAASSGTPDSAPTMAFTPPTATGPDTPDAAPTMTFTPPASASSDTPDSAPTMAFTPQTRPTAAPRPDTAPVTADAAPTMTFTPPAPQGRETVPDPALTMASFTPPLASKQPLDRAATVAAFAPPKIATTGTSTPVRSVPAAVAGGRKLSPVLVLGCLFAIVCVGGIVALAVAVNSRFGNAPDPTTPAAFVAIATPTTAAAAASTTAPLNTSVSTSTSVPANTPLPAPSSTPQPAPSSTPIALPQSNPPVVSPATATPTQTPEPATPTTEPTATDTSVPPPTRPARPAVEFPVSFSYVGYEKWGRPNSDCTQFNNKDAVRQFKWEESVTNRTAATITGADWGIPAVTSNEGTQVPICGYGAPDIPPGQTAKVTFAAYVALNQFVQHIQHQIRSTTYIRCLDASPKEVTC